MNNYKYNFVIFSSQGSFNKQQEHFDHIRDSINSVKYFPLRHRIDVCLEREKKNKVQTTSSRFNRNNLAPSIKMCPLTCETNTQNSHNCQNKMAIGKIVLAIFLTCLASVLLVSADFHGGLRMIDHKVKLPTTRPLIIAHRGASGIYPEHTGKSLLLLLLL